VIVIEHGTYREAVTVDKPLTLISARAHAARIAAVRAGERDCDDLSRGAGWANDGADTEWADDSADVVSEPNAHGRGTPAARERESRGPAVLASNRGSALTISLARSWALAEQPARDGDGGELADGELDVVVRGLRVLREKHAQRYRTAAGGGHGGGGGHGVSVQRGALRLEGCDVSSEAGVGVLVSAGASARLTRCELRAAAFQGLFVSGKGRVTLAHCDVHTNGAAGVEVRGGASVAMHGCRLAENGKSGAFVHAFGHLIAERCEFSANCYGGVEVGARGSARVRESVIANGCKGGVLVLAGGEAHVSVCQLENNALAHIAVREYGHCAVVDCYLARGGASGVHALDGGHASVRECTIVGNRACAIEVQGGELEEEDNWIDGSNRGGKIVIVDGQGHSH
jgi:hypothetical protein